MRITSVNEIIKHLCTLVSYRGPCTKACKVASVFLGIILILWRKAPLKEHKVCSAEWLLVLWSRSWECRLVSWLVQKHGKHCSVQVEDGAGVTKSYTYHLASLLIDSLWKRTWLYLSWPPLCLVKCEVSLHKARCMRRVSFALWK